MAWQQPLLSVGESSAVPMAGRAEGKGLSFSFLGHPEESRALSHTRTSTLQCLLCG